MRTALFLLLLLPLSAHSETVINYDDGSTYTLVRKRRSTLPKASCLHRKTTPMEMFILLSRKSTPKGTMFPTQMEPMIWLSVLMNGAKLMYRGMRV